MNIKTLTIITPTYNRAFCLNNAYESMRRQKNNNFNWLIIDDGSTDNTEELVSKFKETSPFEIQYIKKENGGKHRALNLGIANANSELIFILDSDDYLTDNAVETILNYHEKSRNFDKICGYSFLRIKPNGQVIGRKFPHDYFISNHIDCRFNDDIWGDKAEVFFTSVLKNYSFPEIEGENFITEAIVWSKMGRDYNTVYINEPIQICEYLPGGLTSKYDMLCINNPKGMARFCKENCDSAYIPSIQSEYTQKYIAYSLLAGETLENIIKSAPKQLQENDINEGMNLYSKYCRMKEEYKNKSES